LSYADGAAQLWRLLAVRAVVDFEMSQADAAAQYGASSNTMSQWVPLYHERGEAGLAVQPQGRPQGAGRALSEEQGEAIRQLVVDSLPCDPDIASATWTRQAVAELMAKRMGVELILQGVGQYLRRWGLTPQKPARQVREQDPNEVEAFVQETLPEVKAQARAEGAQLHVVDEVGVRLFSLRQSGVIHESQHR
jgi:transposase